MKNFCQKNLPQTNTNNMDKLIASLVEKTITKYITVVSEKFELDSEELSAMWSEVSGIKKRAKSTKRSGYMLFCSDERPSIKKSSPDMKPSAVMKELGGRWKKLSEKKQQVWREKANVPVKDGDWVNMTTAQLKEACKTQKLKSTGNKAKLIERLENPDDDGNQSDSGSGITVKELKEELKTLGHSVSGSKAVLIKRLEDVKSGNDDSEEDNSDDNSDDYSKMTVKDLKAECKTRNLKKFSTKKKAELVTMLQESDESSNEDSEGGSDGGSDAEGEWEDVEEVEVVEDGEVEDGEVEVDYSKMTVKDLKAECKKKGLEKYSKMKKVELVEILQKSDGSDEGSDNDCDDCQDSSDEEA